MLFPQLIYIFHKIQNRKCNIIKTGINLVYLYYRSIHIRQINSLKKNFYADVFAIFLFMDCVAPVFRLQKTSFATTNLFISEIFLLENYIV